MRILFVVIFILGVTSCGNHPTYKPPMPAGSVCSVGGKEVITTTEGYSGNVLVHYTNEFEQSGLKAKPLRMYVSESILICE